MSGIVGQNLGRGSGLVKKTAVAADAVTGSEIADDAIDSEHYTDGSIDNAHIADDAIDSEHYAAASIDNAHLADDAVDSDELAAGSVDTAHIADNQVTLAKMAGGTDGNIISFDASGDPVAIATGSDGQVLTSTGAGSPPAFEAVAAGGITHAELWNMNTAFTGEQNPISGNWSQTWTGDIGDASGLGADSVTEASGVFSFAVTGIWRVDFTCSYSDNSAVDHDIFAEIHTTVNNSTYLNSSRAGASLFANSGYTSGRASILLDITDVSNQKVRFHPGSVASSTYVYGHGDYIHTYAIFTRLGDT